MHVFFGGGQNNDFNVGIEFKTHSNVFGLRIIWSVNNFLAWSCQIYMSFAYLRQKLSVGPAVSWKHGYQIFHGLICISFFILKTAALSVWHLWDALKCTTVDYKINLIKLKQGFLTHLRRSVQLFSTRRENFIKRSCLLMFEYYICSQHKPMHN